MHVNPLARINPADTPTAFVFAGGCWVSHHGTAHVGLTLSFDGVAEARRWLEDAADALIDAEKQAVRHDQEQIREARYDAESSGDLAPRVLP